MSARSSDSPLQAALGWLLRPAPRIWTLAVLGIALGALMLYGFRIQTDHQLSSRLSTVQNHQTRDEHTTCVIQAQGLPAGHQLSATMSALYQLLSLRPTTKAERLAASQIPASEKALLEKLALHLHRYTLAESKQPPSRSC